MPIIINPKESIVYLEYKVDEKYFKWYDKIIAHFINKPQPLYTLTIIGQGTNDVVKSLIIPPAFFNSSCLSFPSKSV